jgi:hypothetical protein
MLNLPRLSRLVESGEFERILEEVSRNGRPLPIGVRLRLSEPAGLPPSAMGLALQRVCELTYRPTPLAVALARGILDRQDAGGLFGTLSATAVALAALFSFSDQLALLTSAAAAERFGVDEDLARKVRRAVEAAVHRLHRAQEESPAGRLGEPPTLIGDELDSAIVLWQLGLEPRFTAAVRFGELLSAMDERGLRHQRGTAPLLRRLDESRDAEAPTELGRRSAA